jgi:formylglycine-generating enzyme required for sulfatase activity
MDSRYDGMVLVKAGSFMMGSLENDDIAQKDEFPMHKVTLNAYYIDKTEVTQKDYKSLMGINPSVFTGDDMCPVENVSWYDALLYCNARSAHYGLEQVYRYTGKKGKPGEACEGLENLVIDYSIKGFRLPTEAEWECACRAGTTTRYYWGDKYDESYLWCEENSGGKSHPVATKKPNAWGLYDMSGNMQEWCNDWYGEGYYAASPSHSPKGPDSGIHRKLRGGSWCLNTKRNSRCANHGSCNVPEYHRDAYGFRCVIPV